jgi:hypothetical protein
VANGFLTVTNGAKGLTLELPLTGVCSGVTFSPNSLSLAVAAGYKSLPQQVTLTNTLSSAIGITSIVVSGGAFAQTNTCGTSVPAMGTCTISVTFSAAAAQSYSGSITVTDTQEGLTVKEAPITLTGAGEAQVSLYPSWINISFTGEWGGSGNATLTNNLPTTLNNISLSPGSGFYIGGTTCGTSLPASASCTINVGTGPGPAASWCSNLVVSDSANNSPQSINVCAAGW